VRHASRRPLNEYRVALISRVSGPGIPLPMDEDKKTAAARFKRAENVMFVIVL
jgi:hypothetical protein